MSSETFTVRGENGNFLRITFVEVYGFPEATCSWGGYEVRAALEIKSYSFSVSSTLWTSTGEIFQLFEQLRRCQEAVAGIARYESYEHQLTLSVAYQAMGQTIIRGTFSENTDCSNTLEFEFSSDQSFIQDTLSQLQRIMGKYGDMKGIH